MDDAERIAEITARFRAAGYELRFSESVPGAWDAIWHPHGRGSGLARDAARTAVGATLLEAAERALAALEAAGGGAGG
ncbi:hypothetical protein [Miltoncostaea marina]|uniref:hypothetical protein n=1 Tax=Miltoncostaea marina TaxID=2843215 RepID=UPI001C3CB924|nr:hypothetical protein [Miltoncostaea marina]